MGDGLPGSKRFSLPLSTLLLIAGVVIILTVALIYLQQKSSSQSTAALIMPTNPAKAGPTQPPPDNTGRIAFRCTLNASAGFCIADATGDHLAPLANPKDYEAAHDREVFAPDRAWMAYAWQQHDKYSLLLRSTQSGWVNQLTVPYTTTYAPAVSADGHYLAFVAQEQAGSSIHIYDLFTGGERRLTAAAAWHDDHPSWSPDGRAIVFTSDRSGRAQLFTIASDGTGLRQLPLDGASGWDPIWIKPRITGEAVVPNSQSHEALGIGAVFDDAACALDVNAGDDSGAAPISRVRLQRAGAAIYDSGAINTPLLNAHVALGTSALTQQVLIQAWNTGAFSQAPKELQRTFTCLDTALLPTAALARGPSVTPSPTYIVVTPQRPPENVFAAATAVAEATTGARLHGTATPTPPNLATATATLAPLIVTPTATPANQATGEYQAALATAIAFTTGTARPPDVTMVIASATPTWTPTPVPTASPLPTATPVFVPWAGTAGIPSTPTATPIPPVPNVLRGRILFYSDRDRSNQVFVVNPDGSGLARLTSDWPYKILADQEVRSQDGKYLLFIRNDFNAAQLFVHDFQFNVDKQVTVMGVGASWEPAFDPGGWRIAFTSNEPGNDEIFVVNRDGTSLQRLTRNTWEWDRHPSWSPDGQQLVFWSNRSGRKQLYVMSADGRDVHSISDGWGNDWDPIWVK